MSQILRSEALPSRLTASGHLLVASALACRRGTRLLFSGLDLTVAAGDAIWITGPNGQGKTSLLRLLAGLSTPEAGRIERAAPLTYIGHRLALKAELTVWEALAFLAQLPAQAVSAQPPHPNQLVCGLRESMQHALQALSMWPYRHARVRTLSEGQRHRLALSRLACGGARPGIWLLDEPFDALDPDGVRAACHLMAQCREAGGAVVLTSHADVPLDGVRPLALRDWAGGA